MRFVWFSESEAFDKSIAIVTVQRGGGRGLLKPVATLWASGNGAEVMVERKARRRHTIEYHGSSAMKS